MYNSSLFLRKACFVFLLLACVAGAAAAQDISETRRKAAELVAQDKDLEALPYLQKIVAAAPDDPNAHYELGFALVARSATQTDPAKKAADLKDARNAFLKARELGIEKPLLDGMIESIAPDGVEKGKFSFNEEAEKLMREGESAFVQNDMDKALSLYQKALKLDPTIYYAAVFSGDVFMQKGDFDNAEVWYQNAISIDPYVETAYRYSATPLMKQGKTEEALQRYIEAYIIDPYSKFAISGLVQWGNITSAKLGHPKIDIPEFKIGADGKANSTIKLGSLENSASLAWLSYSVTRTEWYNTKFKKMFPYEAGYRHSLMEEVEALRSVIKAAAGLKGKDSKPDPQLALLAKLDNEGLLESYVLLALADKGIAADHFKYMKNERAKMRKYVNEYVIHR